MGRPDGALGISSPACVDLNDPLTKSPLINNRRWRGQRFGLAARREEGASPQWGCDRRTTTWPAQRSAAPHRLDACSLFHIGSLFFHSSAAAGICELAF